MEKDWQIRKEKEESRKEGSMKIYAIVVKYGSFLRYLTGKTNNHTPVLTDNFCEAKTFMRKIDALEYAKGMKKYKDELQSAGVTVEDGIFITEVDMYFADKLEL